MEKPQIRLCINKKYDSNNELCGLMWYDDHTKYISVIKTSKELHLDVIRKYIVKITKDENNNITKVLVYENIPSYLQKDTPMFKAEYTYDDKNNIVYVAEMYTEQWYEYDEFGNIIFTEFIDHDEQYFYTVKYTYDKFGNCIDAITNY